MNTKNTSKQNRTTTKSEFKAAAQKSTANTNSKRQAEQPEELSASQKQQRFAKVVALVLAAALALSFVAPVLASLFS